MVLGGESGGWWCFAHKEREPEEFFMRNGARLLEESIASFEGSGNKSIRMFSAEELQKATNNYAHRNLDHFCTYKGKLEGLMISVKNPNKFYLPNKFFHHGGGSHYLQNSINEAVILSHIHHPNVVKLLGCCIETEIPILVFESFSNGTLYRHLHEADPSSPQISWENRLKIATETAYALTYLQTSTSLSIVHSDIHSKNILLGESYDPKVIGFGLSVLLPLGETHVNTMFRGTGGFVDPSYVVTGRLTEKTDVYNFGGVLLELLTREKIMTIDNKGEYWFLPEVISGKMGTDLILKANEFEEGKRDQLVACKELALRCIKSNEEERPTMKEVVQELKRIKRSKQLL